jgi:hypothetical protein
MDRTAGIADEFGSLQVSQDETMTKSEKRQEKQLQKKEMNQREETRNRRSVGIPRAVIGIVAIDPTSNLIIGVVHRSVVPLCSIQQRGSALAVIRRFVFTEGNWIARIRILVRMKERELTRQVAFAQLSTQFVSQIQCELNQLFVSESLFLVRILIILRSESTAFE